MQLQTRNNTKRGKPCGGKSVSELLRSKGHGCHIRLLLRQFPFNLCTHKVTLRDRYGTGPGYVQLFPSYLGFSFSPKPPVLPITSLTPFSLLQAHGSSLVSSLNLSELSQVLAPSQFLITVPLRGLTGYRECQVRHWRYYTVNGAKLLSSVRDPEELHQWLEVEQFSKSLQQWHEEDVNIEGDLVPAKVLIVFRELVEKSIISCNLSSKVTVLESFSSVVRVAVETSESQVEVELVPAVEIPTCWPEKARWPRCLKRWPSQEKVRCIKSLGFDLLARSNYHWQLCFSRAEHILMEGLDEDGGCRMKCFRVMRQMKEDVWCAGNKPVITAYHLQTVLFWTCEKYPRTKDWRCFPEAFLRLVQKLHKCVSQHFLKHYFLKNTNLLKYANTSDLDLVASKLAVFLENPVFCLD
ncbi:protein mab-21-like 3 isoform X1 [Manacus candei]|uniref:protein mab-21-like 3 isoform X1 n=1 Tax=Manacus candei TaxID=415023 RepID=UPI00222807CE|nr:protein mab-21-like 3 isoform X1 [Manacus candei]